MKYEKIILVRHGESQGNVDPDVYERVPDWRLDLTERGCRQAMAAGVEVARLVPQGEVQAYVSPYRRTMRTYECMAQAFAGRVRMFQDPRLREQDWGHLREAKATKEIKRERDEYGTFWFRFPDGESGADVYDRVTSFMDTLWRDMLDTGFTSRAALIVTHGLTMRLFCMRWFHWTVEQYEQLANPGNCEFKVLELQASGRYVLTTPFGNWEGGAAAGGGGKGQPT